MGTEPLDPQKELGVGRDLLPRHVAIIMDGNGRWAKQRGLPRIAGHQQGARAVRAVVTHCARLGLDALTLYSFSAENWKRPREEVDFLMGLYGQYLVAERGEILDNNVRLIHVGSRAGLPDHVLHEMDVTVEQSRSNTGLKLCLALNYGSRNEIVEAVRSIAAGVRDGRIDAEAIDEKLVSDSLYTAGIADPDLLIRTANEQRLSNFLLWQISYAEFYIVDCLWPDFRVSHLNDAFCEYARRERRYGATAPPSPRAPRA